MGYWMCRMVSRGQDGRTVGPSLLRTAFFVMLLGIAPNVAAQGAVDYALEAGDVVEFDFLDDTELPRQLIVASDGSIQVPLLGTVKVAGLYANDALASFQREFLDRHLLVDPKISLSVVTFRPIYVLGEVKSPGSFPFRPLLTVEQAVGLAGGPLTQLGVAEDRVVTRARLRGEIAGSNADLTKEAMGAAQSLARLNNVIAIADSNVPELARAYLNPNLVRELRETGEQILGIEKQSFDTQKALLTEGIAEAERQLQIFDQLATNQKQTIQASKDQIDRIGGLFKKGLTVADEVNQLQRQLTSDEGRLLSIYSETSDTRQQVSSMKRELTLLEELRRREALSRLQEHVVAIEKLIADRTALEEQLYLVSNLMAEEASATLEIVLEYKTRRRTNDGFEEGAAKSTTLLSPGDVVIVSLKRPSQKTNTSQ